MSEEVSERTPLLAESATVAAPLQDGTTETGNTASASNNNNNTSPDDHYASFRRPFLLLTSFLVFLSIVAFLTSAATALIVAELSPPGWYLGWYTRDLNSYMVITTAFTTAVGAVNLARLHHENRLISLLFNFVVDLIFMCYLFVCSVGILEYALSSQYPCHARYGGGGDGEACLPIAIAVRVLLIISSGSELILVFVILTLFLMRCVLMYKLRPWNAIQRRNGRWSVPTGVLSLEISIKFLRQEERVEAERSE